MVITVEISMYAFREDYRVPIDEFVERLNGYKDLKVTRGLTSTVIIGEYSHVMNTITEMIQWSYDKHGRAVFVTKFVPGYDAGKSSSAVKT
jgi:hypothetical protein